MTKTYQEALDENPIEPAERFAGKGSHIHIGCPRPWKIGLFMLKRTNDEGCTMELLFITQTLHASPVYMPPH